MEIIAGRNYRTRNGKTAAVRSVSGTKVYGTVEGEEVQWNKQGYCIQKGKKYQEEDYDLIREIS